MKNDVQEKFDKYIETYTKLSIDDKKKEIIEKLRNMISNCELINRNFGRNHDLLINRELIDLKEIPLTEKDFLEGIFVYIHTLDDEVSDLLNYLINQK
ncbi:MAG: hypothetical protein IKE75_00950 [Bacilli bacterium]|nr:hypothetical protein [Bacilli bacterium]